MYEKIYVFGDSWGFGSELDLPNEQPFGFWVQQMLGSGTYENLSQPGASLGLILQKIVYRFRDISAKDLVMIVIPPDVRWYDQSEDLGWFPLFRDGTIIDGTVIDDRNRYQSFLQDKTIEWFEYHHILFIYALQKLLKDCGCDFIMAHNYGQLPDFAKYGLDIDLSKFLDQKSLTALLSDKVGSWHGYQLDDDEPPEEDFNGKYFQGKVCHPNELGHKKIAEYMFNKIKERSIK